MVEAAAEGLRRWAQYTQDRENARTQEEGDAADAALTQIIRDEDSGLIPFVPIEDSLPLYVPLPTREGEVYVELRPSVPTTKPDGGPSGGTPGYQNQDEVERMISFKKR